MGRKRPLTAPSSRMGYIVFAVQLLMMAFRLGPKVKALLSRDDINNGPHAGFIREFKGDLIKLYIVSMRINIFGRLSPRTLRQTQLIFAKWAYAGYLDVSRLGPEEAESLLEFLQLTAPPKQDDIGLTRFCRPLSRILPPTIRARDFEPRYEELLRDYVIALEGQPARLTRYWLAFCYGFHTFLLLIECLTKLGDRVLRIVSWVLKVIDQFS